MAAEHTEFSSKETALHSKFEQLFRAMRPPLEDNGVYLDSLKVHLLESAENIARAIDKNLLEQKQYTLLEVGAYLHLVHSHIKSSKEPGENLGAVEEFLYSLSKKYKGRCEDPRFWGLGVHEGTLLAGQLDRGEGVREL